MLLADLVESRIVTAYAAATPCLRAFELQILEELLRRPRSYETTRSCSTLCAKICAKIGWPTPIPERDVVSS